MILRAVALLSAFFHLPLCQSTFETMVIKFINRKRMAQGGPNGIQDVTQTAQATSTPNVSQSFMGIQNDGEVSPAIQAYGQSPQATAQIVAPPVASLSPNTITVPSTIGNQSNGSVSVFNQNIGGNLAGEGGVGSITMQTIQPQSIATPGLTPESVINEGPITPKVYVEPQVEEETQEKRSQDGNTLDFMSMPYYPASTDLEGRAALLGRSLGRGRAATYQNMWRNATTSGQKAATIGAGSANALQGIASAVSLGMGLYRNIESAASEEAARQKDLLGRRERLANERRNSFIQYTEQGGGIHTGNGNTFDTQGLTGEYIYPLSKSMEDNANVEIEKGEYVIRPDVEAPMEALGKKHSKGGTPVSLPEDTHVVSDYRKITPEFVELLLNDYGIRSSVRDTYASVIDKYKKKIGLKELYEDQEKVYKRLKKNQDVKDDNTSELNKSILSKFVADNQEKIDALEPELRRFSEMVYEHQEASKRADRMNEFFKEGGRVDLKKLRKAAKAEGITEDRAKELIYEAYEKRLRMPDGGHTVITKEDEERGLNQANLFRDVFGRPLNFSIVQVEGRGDILNPGTTDTEEQGLQHSNDPGFYGRARRSSIGNLLNVNRWARPLYNNDDFNTLEFQSGYNDRLNQFWAIANAGGIQNAKDAMDFRHDYGFLGQQTSDYANPDTVFDSAAYDGKYGQWTATRAYGALDVVTPEQLSALNKAGISNYVDLFGENSGKAKEILGEDYSRFQRLQDSGLFNNMDFILAAHTPRPANLPPAEDIEVDDFNPELEAPVIPGEVPAPATIGREQSPAGESPARRPVQNNYGFGIGYGLMPEILRHVSSGIITEGLERHQAPHMEPVTESAGQYINEMNRVMANQYQALQDVPDSQRAAIMANLQAIQGTNTARYINDVNYRNAERREAARRYNSEAYTTTDDKNIAERQRYEASTLRAMAIDEENRARYLDHLNQEAQQKFNTYTSLNTVRALAPDMRMLPNGQIVYASNQDIVPGDWSTGYFERNDEDARTRTTRRVRNADGSTTTVTTTSRYGGRIR